jgi:hypothetical protein
MPLLARRDIALEPAFRPRQLHHANSNVEPSYPYLNSCLRPYWTHGGVRLLRRPLRPTGSREESHGFACRCGWWTREQGVFVCWTRKFRLWADRNLADVQGSYPHTPHSPTAASLLVWERASEALLEPDMTIGYEMTKGMEEFAGHLRGGRSMRAWLRGWVEGRTLVSQV